MSQAGRPASPLTPEETPPAAGGVPFVALDRQHASLADDLQEAFARVTASSGFILGDEVEAFEAEFAAYCGVKHCVGVASGTAALTIALSAAGIGAGDEVIVPAHTFIASALGVIHAGATPVLCDVQDATGLIDPEAAQAAITRRTAAIVAVHLYGQCCDMDRIGALARRHGLHVLEDAAQAHGANHRDRRAGSLGHAAAFSFYPSKNLGALGDGGAICTDDDGLAATARQLRDPGQRSKGEHALLGFNERLDGLQAAFLRAKLPHLDAWNVARRRHAARYQAKLTGHVGLLPERPADPSVHHLFLIRVKHRDALAHELQAAGVQTGVHYAPALHGHQALARWTAANTQELPTAEAWAAEELSLPILLTDAEVEYVAHACVRALEATGAKQRSLQLTG